MKITIFLFFSLTCQFVFGQDCDFEKGLDEITSLNNSGKFNDALARTKQLFDCESIPDDLKIELYIAQYKAHRNNNNFKEGEVSLNSAIKKDYLLSPDLDFELRFLLMENYGHLSNLDGYNSLIRKIKNKVFSLTINDNSLAGRYYLSIFRVSNKNSDLSLAIDHLQNASTAFEKLKKPPVFYYNNTLKSLGNMYRTAGDFDKSLFYYKKGKSFLEQHYEPDHYEIAFYDYKIGAVYYEKMEYQAALDHFLAARKVWVHLLESDARYMRYLNEAIGDMYWELGDPENALLYFNYSIVDEKKVNNDKSNEAIVYADSLVENGNYAAAISYYEEAYRWREKEFGKNNVQTGACKNFVARAIRFSGDTEGALAAYQEAINILVPDLSEPSWYANPTAEMEIRSHLYLLESLIAKGDLLKELFSSSNNLKDLETALKTQVVAIELLEDLKNSQLSEGSRAFWTNRTLMLVESSIETAMQLYALTQENNYLYQAFNFSERSKALLLLASLYDQEIQSFSNVSKEIISEEINLKKSINDYQGKIESEEKRCADVRGKMLSLWKTKLDALQNDYDLLIKKIKEEYPDYYHLKYNTQFADVSVIQKRLLDSNTALISYFSGTKNTYVYFVSYNSISVRKLTNSKLLNEETSLFFSHISSQKQLVNEPQLVFDEFVTQATGLYVKLLEPELKGANYSNLIIIPDGRLCYLPFEILITSEVAHTRRDYTSLPYVLKNHAISYSPSASVRLLAEKEDTRASRYLGFAPDYDGQIYTSSNSSDETLKNLQYTEQEIKVANELFKGKSITGKYVSEDLIKNDTEDVGILHLAMHGAIEDKHPLLSKLYFNSSPQNDGMLHIFEIYNLKIPAQLVILSACNTASGKLMHGEGIVSLERAFQYAGSKALLSTLWTVDDAASLQLTEYFLQNLKSGAPKDIALREAKLQLLSTSTPEKLHPFFWSSFKLTGNTQPLKMQSHSRYRLIGLGIIGVVFGLVFYIRKKRNTA